MANQDSLIERPPQTSIAAVAYFASLIHHCDRGDMVRAAHAQEALSGLGITVRMSRRRGRRVKR